MIYPPSLLGLVIVTCYVPPWLVDSTFRVGHLRRLWPSWRHNHFDFGPFLIHNEVGSSLSSSSISLQILVDLGRPFSRINLGFGITILPSCCFGHSNLSFSGEYRLVAVIPFFHAVETIHKLRGIVLVLGTNCYQVWTGDLVCFPFPARACPVHEGNPMGMSSPTSVQQWRQCLHCI